MDQRPTFESLRQQQAIYERTLSTSEKFYALTEFLFRNAGISSDDRAELDRLFDEHGENSFYNGEEEGRNSMEKECETAWRMEFKDRSHARDLFKIKKVLGSSEYGVFGSSTDGRKDEINDAVAKLLQAVVDSHSDLSEKQTIL